MSQNYDEMSIEQMRIQAERNRIENTDQKEDAQRKMAWYAMTGMLVYPLVIFLSVWTGFDSAAEILGDMAATYFVSVAAIVAAFYAKEGYVKKNQDDHDMGRRN